MVVGLGRTVAPAQPECRHIGDPRTLLKMSGSAEAAGSGSTGDPEKAPPRQRMANLSLGRIRTLLRDNCTDRNVIEKAALFHKLAQEKAPNSTGGRSVEPRPHRGMMDILELPKTMSKCLALAEVIAQDDDDDDDDDGRPVGVNAEGEHVIEMIDDNEWDDIFNAQARENRALPLSLFSPSALDHTPPALDCRRRGVGHDVRARLPPGRDRAGHRGLQDRDALISGRPLQHEHRDALAAGRRLRLGAAAGSTAQGPRPVHDSAAWSARRLRPTGPTHRPVPPPPTSLAGRLLPVHAGPRPWTRRADITTAAATARRSRRPRRPRGGDRAAARRRLGRGRGGRELGGRAPRAACARTASASARWRARVSGAPGEPAAWARAASRPGRSAPPRPRRTRRRVRPAACRRPPASRCCLPAPPRRARAARLDAAAARRARLQERARVLVALRAGDLAER